MSMKIDGSFLLCVMQSSPYFFVFQGFQFDHWAGALILRSNQNAITARRKQLCGSAVNWSLISFER